MLYFIVRIFSSDKYCFGWNVTVNSLLLPPVLDVCAFWFCILRLCRNAEGSDTDYSPMEWSFECGFWFFFSLNGIETIAVAWSECIKRNYPSLAVGLCEPQIVFRLSLSIIVCLLFVTCWLNSLVTYTLWLSIENSAIFATWHSSKINEIHILQKLCVEHEAWVIE